MAAMRLYREGPIAAMAAPTWIGSALRERKGQDFFDPESFDLTREAAGRRAVAAPSEAGAERPSQGRMP